MTAVIAGALDVCVLVDVLVIDEVREEEVWIGVALPPIADLQFPPGEWVMVLLAGILGSSAELDDVDFSANFPGDGSGRYAIVARWCSV